MFSRCDGCGSDSRLHRSAKSVIAATAPTPDGGLRAQRHRRGVLPPGGAHKIKVAGCCKRSSCKRPAARPTMDPETAIRQAEKVEVESHRECKRPACLGLADGPDIGGWQSGQTLLPRRLRKTTCTRSPCWRCFRIAPPQPIVSSSGWGAITNTCSAISLIPGVQARRRILRLTGRIRNKSSTATTIAAANSGQKGKRSCAARSRYALSEIACHSNGKM